MATLGHQRRYRKAPGLRQKGMMQDLGLEANEVDEITVRFFCPKSCNHK
jgi:hypothetical protein